MSDALLKTFMSGTPKDQEGKTVLFYSSVLMYGRYFLLKVLTLPQDNSNHIFIISGSDLSLLGWLQHWTNKDVQVHPVFIRPSFHWLCYGNRLSV